MQAEGLVPYQDTLPYQMKNALTHSLQVLPLLFVAYRLAALLRIFNGRPMSYHKYQDLSSWSI